jgi:demethoxyubiquinone hydroxylase (CLK1/Coq7/Cat5 family)
VGEKGHSYVVGVMAALLGKSYCFGVSCESGTMVFEVVVKIPYDTQIKQLNSC